MSPAVSIVMPFRNAARTLQESVDSILRQTLREWELIAIDDGSTDGSAAMFPPDPRVRLLRPGRLGLVRALNLGLAEARAPLIARMDADDIMLARRLERQAGFLEQTPQITLVASRVEMFPENETRGGYREYLRWQDSCDTPERIAANIFVEAPFVHPSVMFRSAAGLAYREGEFPEDYELWLRMHESRMEMAKVPEVLLKWRQSAMRTTSTDPRYSNEAFDRIRAEYLERDPRLLCGRPVVIWGAGRRTRQRLRHLLPRIQLAAWIDIDPRKTGGRLNGVPVHQPEWLAQRDKPFVLACVTTRGARELIASRLDGLGYALGTDYLPVGM